jgi:hypothetical protein
LDDAQPAVALEPAEQPADPPSPNTTPLSRGLPLAWPSGVARGIQRVHYHHDAMVDLIISRQGCISQGEIAEFFGFTEGWISQIINSDAFQSRLAARKDELTDPIIRASVEERIKGLVERSLEILREKLAAPSAQVPATLALRAFELSTRAAGYGARTEATQVNVNVETHLEGLSENLVALLRRKKAEAEEPVDAQIEPPAASPQP